VKPVCLPAIQGAAKAAQLGIRTAIGPMTGLPRQRRLKWIETLKTLRLPAWQVVNKRSIL